MRNRIILIGIGVLVVAGGLGYFIRQKSLEASSSGDYGMALRTAAPAPMVAEEANTATGQAMPSGGYYDETAKSTGFAGTNKAEAKVERMVIKTGQVSMVVKNVREAIQKISSYATAKQGFVVTSNVSQDGIAPSGSITIRIPVAVYDAGFTDVKALGEVKSESNNGEDVTNQYVDLDSRLRNLKATESQLLEIMKRAVKISDVLEVQAQLTQVRGEIESLQGQMKYLKDSAAMSSLTVYLSTDPGQLPVVNEPTDTWKPISEFKNALRSLLGVAKTISYGIIWLVVYVPLWAVAALVVWLVARSIRRRMGRTESMK